MPVETTHKNVLVIKLSALGDFILSVGAFQAIRAHHPGARIALLTTEPFRKLAEASGCFDEIWTAGWRSAGACARCVSTGSTICSAPKKLDNETLQLKICH